MKRLFPALLALSISFAARPVAGQAQAAACRAAPAGADAADLLRRAAAAMGIDAAAAAGRALHFQYIQSDAQAFQSDRSYPPFFDAMRVGERWYDPSSGLERADDRRLYPRQGPAPTANPVYTNGRGAFIMRDTAVAYPSQATSLLRVDWELDPWAIVNEWRGDAASVRVSGICPFRDDDRIVLERTTGERTDRLFLDRDTGLPVRLDYVAPNYLWGQVHTEVMYSLWIRAGEGLYPAAAHAMDDGEVRISRTVGTIEQVPAADAAIPPPPAALASAALPPRAFGPISPLPVDTVRVSDDTFLLVNRYYTETVTLQRDTVFLLDGTLGEERARQDSAWIAKLFPGDHPVVLLITDLAWPHIAGMRSWIAMGATVASHPSFEPFLRRVAERAWTLDPDLLERRRGSARFRFRPVTDGSTFAGGAVRIHTIDGIGSENALIAWIPDDGYLWASDFIQTVDAPSQYAAEVSAAVRRAGITPERVAAQHLPLMPWSRVLEANPRPR